MVFPSSRGEIQYRTILPAGQGRSPAFRRNILVSIPPNPGVTRRRGHGIRSAEVPLDPNAIKEWAGALAPYIAFFTAFWAILTYRRAKKVEVARLQKQIFDDLFLSGKFDRIREALDWDYSKKIGPVLRTLRAEPGQVAPADRNTLTELDNFLNLIEYVLYLEQDKKLLTAAPQSPTRLLDGRGRARAGVVRLRFRI
jgi:hypothetical protein